MPIDARIPLQAQAPPPMDPFGSLGEILKLRAFQHREQKEARELAREQQMEALAQQYGDDPDEFFKQYSKVDPAKAMEFKRTYEHGRKAEFDRYEAKLKVDRSEIGNALQELQGIAPTDVPGYANFYARWTSKNPELGQVLPAPDRFGPDVHTQLLNVGRSTDKFLEANEKALVDFREGKYRKGLAEVLAVVPSFELAKQKIDEARAATPKSAQGDIALFESFIDQADGNIATFQALAGNAALTEKDRLDLQEKSVDNERQAATQAETLRHNRVMEGQGAQRIAQDRSNGPGGGPKPGDAQLVQAILKNPGLYAGVTPTTKERLIGPLMEAGFTGFAAGQTGKPPTGAQNRALNFFNRAKEASDQLAELNVKGLGTLGQAWINNMPNVAQSQLGQSYNAAAAKFTEARLRKDSGAAIPPHEYEADRKMYFQQAGDTDETLAQKEQGRAAVLASLAFEAGPALHGFYGDEADSILQSYKDAMKKGGGGNQGAGPKEGDTKPMPPGYPAGSMQQFRNGKWIRTK